jgi:hypothetical protein
VSVVDNWKYSHEGSLNSCSGEDNQFEDGEWNSFLSIKYSFMFLSTNFWFLWALYVSMIQFKSQIEALNFPPLAVWMKIEDLSEQNNKIWGSLKGIFLCGRATNNFSTEYSMEIINYFNQVFIRIRTADFNTQHSKYSPNGVFMCSIWFSQQMILVVLRNTHRFVSLSESTLYFLWCMNWISIYSVY